jgi:23S rRNA (adenine2503-C2)-methyltransferase
MFKTPPGSPPINLLTLDQSAANALVEHLGWAPYRVPQLFRWLYRYRIHRIDQMTDFPLHARERLNTLADIRRMKVVQVLTSEDGTKKFLASFEDGLVVESVLIPEGDRLTLCVSTQVGCTLDCGFCLTGTIGLRRNLQAHEIVDQVLTAQDHLPPGEAIKSLVFMGMGEPLANFNAVQEAIRRLTDPVWGVGISTRRMTLSTAGWVPRLKDVADLGVNLAVSLNATTNAQRDRLMPTINRLYPLETLLEACRAYPLPPRRRLTFEYVLLAGVNATPEDAKRLTTLLVGIRSKVNLIPFNEFPDSPYRRPDEATVLRFQSILKEGGLAVFIRKSRGRDVLGACGQLGRLPARPVLLAPAGNGC